MMKGSCSFSLFVTVQDWSTANSEKISGIGTVCDIGEHHGFDYDRIYNILVAVTVTLGFALKLQKVLPITLFNLRALLWRHGRL